MPALLATALEQLGWALFSKLIAPWAIKILKNNGAKGHAEALVATAALKLSEVKAYQEYPAGKNGT